ncbi:MAG: hypothetical protein K0Q52_160 [Microbacterium sp.]|jgi:hypothetical protein|nr:hypothetical protein [Microbacterium sp.]
MTPEQERRLQAVAEADNEYRELKSTLETRLRAQLRKELDAALVRRNIRAAEAKAAEISVTKIANIGLHTKATVTAYQAIADGERYLEKPASADEIVAPVAKEFEAVGKHGQFRITPSNAEVLPILTVLSISEETYAGDAALQSAVFQYDAEKGTIAPVTEAFVPSVGRHPVVALVTQPDSIFGKRARNWAADNLVEKAA